MKQELEELYKKLEKYSDFDQEDNCEKFLDTVDQIVLEGNPNSIQILLEYFNDDSEYSWVLTSLRKSLEQYDQEIYIKKILENLENLVTNCPYWTDEIINSIFNDCSTLHFFKSNMNLVSKIVLFKLLEIMKTESSHHSKLIEELEHELTN